MPDSIVVYVYPAQVAGTTPPRDGLSSRPRSHMSVTTARPAENQRRQARDRRYTDTVDEDNVDARNHEK